MKKKHKKKHTHKKKKKKKKKRQWNVENDKYINKMLFNFKMKKVLHKCAQNFQNIYQVLK